LFASTISAANAAAAAGLWVRASSGLGPALRVWHALAVKIVASAKAEMFLGKLVMRLEWLLLARAVGACNQCSMSNSETSRVSL
jgi:hypothetical protein